MSRLSDYFVVVGYDHDKSRTDQQCGKVLQRFPATDWEDCPFTPGIEMFCQPDGWQLTTQKQQPTFFVSVLTDTDADRHYCAVLTFSEDVNMPVAPPGVFEEEEEEGVAPGSQCQVTKMYAPKSLVLISRLSYFETFRNCLGLIYTVHIENTNVELETLIGNILGCIQVPPPGGPQIRFSVGAGDRQALQPPLYSTLPVTNSAVAMLFKHLDCPTRKEFLIFVTTINYFLISLKHGGIHNCISVFCAALCDHKILFCSQSFTRLTEASHGLSSLMYPLNYSYVYVPILPSRLIEVLSTPTPFIAGVHSSLRDDIADLLDVIIADLDGGSIHVPEHVQLKFMPTYLFKRMVHALNLILHPELLLADDAFPCRNPKSSPLEMVDKEIRAVFLRFFAEFLFGYRSCLTIVRIHKEPVIKFHKASFVGQRGLVDDEFTKRVLDSMSFNIFVAERGPPYRVCDIFDEVFASMQETLQTEIVDPDRLLRNIQDLAQQLYHNENPNAQPYVQKIPKPTNGAHTRIHQPVFPHVNETRVKEIIEEGIAKHNLKSKLTQLRPQQARIVPNGPHISTIIDRMSLISTNARRLDVLRSCIAYIFENKISDARKIFPAVLKALKSKVARLALVEELKFYAQGGKASLEHQQFDLIVRLLNCSLQNESPMDENGIAAAILPLSHDFCRKLCTGVYQFAYTCIQEHAVWGSKEYWEGTFYKDVEFEIRQLYLPQYEEHLLPDRSKPSPRNSPELNGGWSRDLRQAGTTPESKRRSMLHHTPSYRAREISALEIAAEQMRVWPSLQEPKQNEAVTTEESIVYSQAIHYANRMVSLRVPLDVRKPVNNTAGMLEGESMSSHISNSMPESDSYDPDSDQEEQDIEHVSAAVIKFVNRFVDKVCAECNVTPDHIKALHAMIPGVVDMHIEALERVHQESKRLPPIQKPKILTPMTLPGEDIVMSGLRVYLVPDGREEGLGGTIGGPALLPAEGGLVLTTYRIVFKGSPCDPLVSEHTVCRSFPVASLTREKKVSIQSTAQLDQWLPEGLQLRSNTFQLMKIAFDEEVNPEHIEELRKLLVKLRYPSTIGETFAFASYPLIQTPHLKSGKEKHASLKGFAKRTLMKTARKAGLKPKDTHRKQKLVLQTPPMARRSFAGLDNGRDRPISLCGEEELSVIDEQDISAVIQTDSKNVERLAERLYVKDYSRLGLGLLNSNQMRRGDLFRLSLINTGYTVCKSYPAVLVVPQSISDDSVRKFARSHRQYRFPVVTWRHPRTRAVLLRASGFHGKGVMEMLKGKPNAPTGVSTTEVSSTSLEQEKYFSALTAAVPSGNSCSSFPSSSLPGLDSDHFDPLSSSQSSIDSLTIDSMLLWDTPEQSRHMATLNPLTRVVSQIRNAGSKTKSLSRVSSIRERSRSATSTLPTGYNSSSHQTAKQNGTLDPGELADNVANSLHRAALYVLGEKSHVKAIRQESYPKCYFNPVDYKDVRHVKASFKKLMRACSPTSPSTERGFLKAVEDTEWLPQLQNIMLIAGAVVDLIDGWGSSVMICLEDGWDFTTQVVAVAQVLLDPYYRTFEGFRTLIEKEWLAFGHRFTHRSNQTIANQASGFAPIFLQFLDVVHQIHRQFPLSFEFNQYYLKFLAYHHTSCRFRTFMLDNESERVESGWILEERSRSNSMDMNSDSELRSERPSSNGTSIWEYVDAYNKRSPVFYNFHYSPMEQESVLRPYSNMANLHIWEYYTEDDLACGPSYDFESFSKEAQMQEGQDGSGEGVVTPIQRKAYNSCYHNIDQMMPDSLSYIMAEIAQLEQELGQKTEQWSLLWERLEQPSREQLQRQISFNTHIIRSHGVSVHKRSTIEFLAKGKIGDPSKLFSQPHHFEKFSYTTPAYCDYCSHLLWGLAKTGMRCSDCGYNSHEKCVPHTPKNCTRHQPLTEVRQSMTSISKASIADTASLAGETRTHEGYLSKQGALLKGWKSRWFVLDSMKHQLRYYDSPEDTNCKGFIDLADVEFVQTVSSIQGMPKKAGESSFFEMKTNKRVYCFGAPDPKSSDAWVEKIQNSIQ